MEDAPELPYALNPSSRARLGPKQARHFQGSTLLDRLGRAVCKAACLPRKELYESWEVARRVRRRFRGGRIVDLAAGHGLLGQILLILDDSSPRVIAVDPRPPPSAPRLLAALAEEWPRLSDRVEFKAQSLEDVPLFSDDLVVSAHACGSLTDRVLARAQAARAKVAVLPCCHQLGPERPSELSGWLPDAVAIDVDRAARLRAAGYRLHTALIPAAITPQNRLLLGAPEDP